MKRRRVIAVLALVITQLAILIGQASAGFPWPIIIDKP
jgi:hypothetical protein